jgi:hypothetical protein
MQARTGSSMVDQRAVLDGKQIERRMETLGFAERAIDREIWDHRGQEAASLFYQAAFSLCRQQIRKAQLELRAAADVAFLRGHAVISEDALETVLPFNRIGLAKLRLLAKRPFAAPPGGAAEIVGTDT